MCMRYQGRGQKAENCRAQWTWVTVSLRKNFPGENHTNCSEKDKRFKLLLNLVFQCSFLERIYHHFKKVIFFLRLDKRSNSPWVGNCRSRIVEYIRYLCYASLFTPTLKKYKKHKKYTMITYSVMATKSISAFAQKRRLLRVDFY